MMRKITAATAVADVTQKVEGIQAAYSMGAMSIKAYKIDVKVLLT